MNWVVPRVRGTLAAPRFPETVALPPVSLKFNVPTPLVEAIVSVPEP